MPSDSSRSQIDSSEQLRSRYEAARLALLRVHPEANGELRDALTAIGRIVAEALRVERVGVWLFDDAHRVIRCVHLFERSSGEVFEGAVLRVQDFPSYFRALEAQRAVPADDAPRFAATSELRHAYLEPLGIRAMLDAPIFREGHLVGVVCNEDTTETREWSSAEYDFAATVSDTLARVFAESELRDAARSLGKLEARLLQSQSLEAVGRATAALAHDFRSILFAVGGFSQLILETPDVGAEVLEHAMRIHEASERGTALCDAIGAFGKDQGGSPVILDLSSTIASLASMLRMLTGPRIDLRIEVEPGVSRVFVDRVQIERALINLVNNARDAMPAGGTLTLRLRDEAANDAGASACVLLEVADTGVGMDEPTRERMFEPFFTTKPRQGVGLGASIVHQIVTRAGGTLEIVSAPGRGTTVRIRLPRIARGR